MPQAIVAAAIAIGSAVATATAAFVPALIGTFGIASQISAAAIGFGLLEGVQAILPHPQVGQTAAGTQVDWQADPQAPVPYLIGRTGTSGTIAVQDVAGQHNKYLHTLSILSGAGPVKSIGGFAANDEAVSFGTDSGEGASGRYVNRMWFKSRLGNLDANAMAWSASGSKDTPADHGGTPAQIATGKLSGLAAYLLALEYDAAIFPTGVPKPQLVVEGVTAYDPRLDSTYPGGSGAQRAADEGSWAYSQNPFLHALSWCLGRRANGRSTLGLHVPPASIDVAAFVEGANVADAHGWVLGGVIYSTDAKLDVLRAMLIAGSAKPIALGAKISCVVNAPRVSLDTLTGADIVGEAQVAAVQSTRSAPNTIWPRYREEAQGWQIVATDAPVKVDAYVTADGGQRSREVEYTLCQSADQAATLARYDIENGREFGPITLPCKPRWMGFKPGDAITVTEPELGLNGQKCLITNRAVDPATFVVTLTLRSETDGKHAFALGQTSDPPPTPGLTGVDLISIPQPASGSWAISGNAVTATDGTKLPAIVVTGEVDNVYALQVRLEHRSIPATGAAGPWTEGALAPATATRLIDLGVAAGATYEARISYVTINGVPSDTLDLGQVVLPQLLASDTKHLGGVPTGDLTGFVTGTHTVQDLITQLKLDIASGGGGDDGALQAAIDAANQAAADALAASQAAAASKTAADGDAASAAGSASVATAKATAAAGSADASASSATASSTSATAAGGSASTAITAANAASSHADDAGTSAAAAHTERLTAQGASASSSASATAAQGYAAAASASAASVTADITDLAAEVHGADGTGGLKATVTAQAGAIATLDGKTAAYFQVTASSTPGGAAVLSLLSDDHGSNIELSADDIFFGSGMVFDTATNTFATRAGSNVKVIGAGFGAAGNLIEWYGPASTAIADMTLVNGYWAQGTNSVYYQGSPLSAGEGGGGGASAVADDVYGTAYVPASGLGIFAGNLTMGPAGGYFDFNVTLGNATVRNHTTGAITTPAGYLGYAYVISGAPGAPSSSGEILAVGYITAGEQSGSSYEALCSLYGTRAYSSRSGAGTLRVQINSLQSNQDVSFASSLLTYSYIPRAS